jgi:putative solute:sodium symporter small subunit
MAENSDNNAYWAANIRLVTICLVIWALASYGFGILLRPLVAGIEVGGTDLGFWFAQQGSILVFLVLIFFYAWRMNSIDKKFGVDEEGTDRTMDQTTLNIIVVGLSFALYFGIAIWARAGSTSNSTPPAAA